MIVPRKPSLANKAAMDQFLLVIMLEIFVVTEYLLAR
jgi:hypothetical protein